MIWLVLGVILVVAGLALELNPGMRAAVDRYNDRRTRPPFRSSRAWWIGVGLMGMGVILILGGVSSL